MKIIVKSVRTISLSEINISELTKDDFSKLTYFNKEQFTYIFQDSSLYQDSKFYSHFIIPIDHNHLLIRYQKNYETDSPSVN